MKTGAELIAEERQRQIEQEGWSPEHDDQHTVEELAWAAICYAAPGPIYEERRSQGQIRFVDPWPWAQHWDKREKHSRLRQLQIAGALIAAEIDRLQRMQGGAADE